MINSQQIRAPLSPSKRIVFSFISILIPVLFLLLLELCLRFFQYGSAYEQWVESNNGQWAEKGGKYLMLNPDIARKYFHINPHVPVSNEDAFDKVKKTNAFRVFILGESSAAGYPFEPNGSFSKYLSGRLSLVYPDSKIEVINCSMSAINSYTLRDLTPGILEQKPDLILIYTGHNEYYGALGAGSTESIGNSRILVNLVIHLEKFRTFQLIRNTLKAFAGLFSRKTDAPPGTLMAQMIQDQYIGYGSDIYRKGLSQFEGNMNDIVQMITEAHVPLIIGTLTCNTKDQPPFVSLSSSEYPPADAIFKKAALALSGNDMAMADSLFRFAKDLDALRFRAPSEINSILFSIARKYQIHVVDVDSAFKAESPAHLVGNNLMVDHLHPTLRGYQLLGKLFFDQMKESHYLPDSRPRDLPDSIQDSTIRVNQHITALDSLMAHYKIAILKNNWPFKSDRKEFSYSSVIHPKERIDSLAADWTTQKTRWKDAHLLAAEWYLEKKDITRFLKEMDALIAQYPYNTTYHTFVIITLLPLKEYEQALHYLFMSCAVEPTAFNTKWLGSIYLQRGNMDSARSFLNQSITFDAGDPQVWYNLAVTYGEENKAKAISLIDHALTIDPHYRNALILRNTLMKLKK